MAEDRLMRFLAACHSRPHITWDAFFLSVDWLAEHGPVRRRHTRITGARWRYSTLTEVVYKASRSAFCVCASRFSNRGSQWAAWVGLAGCPVLLGPSYRELCPFGVPVEAPHPPIPHDPFSDDDAVANAIQRAMAIPRSEIHEHAKLYMATSGIPCNIDLPGDPALEMPEYWIVDWDHSMTWGPGRPSAFPQ